MIAIVLSHLGLRGRLQGAGQDEAVEAPLTATKPLKSALKKTVTRGGTLSLPLSVLRVECVLMSVYVCMYDVCVCMRVWCGVDCVCVCVCVFWVPCV